MAFNERKVPDGGLGPRVWATAKHRKYSHTFFGTQPLCALAGNGYGDPTGTYGDENVAMVQDCIGGVLPIYYYPIGTQTILSPVSVPATGLNFCLDDTLSDGVNLVFGGSHTGVRGKHVITVGTDADYFARIVLQTGVPTGWGELAFGFRKLEVSRALIDDFDEMAAINIQAGVINIETILNGGTTSTTDTTLDDLEADTEIELEVIVHQSRKVTFKVDTGYPTVSNNSFVFDAAEVVVPFLHTLHNTATGTNLYLKEFEAGYVPQRGV
jgi:hypothetical protein